ncbi:MAG: hypothetical protein MdMp014T_1766 [Treponematales bacterium]
MKKIFLFGPALTALFVTGCVSLEDILHRSILPGVTPPDTSSVVSYVQENNLWPEIGDYVSQMTNPNYKGNPGYQAAIELGNDQENVVRHQGFMESLINLGDQYAAFKRNVWIYRIAFMVAGGVAVSLSTYAIIASLFDWDENGTMVLNPSSSPR